MGEPQVSLEELLAVYVRVFEERMLVDIAAETYANYGYRGGIQRHEIGAVFPGNPDRMLQKLFSRFDADRSGVLDAKELLAVVRYVNFGKGYCDGCFEPIGEKERGFMCVDCSGFILCISCHTINQRDRFHQPRHQFVPASELLAAQNDSFIPGIGNYLRDATTEVFRKMDANGDGHVSHAEFRQYHRALGYSEPVISFLLQFDLDGDGLLSKRELLYMTVGLNMARTCDECGGLSLVGQDEMLSCVECTADYDVCVACWNAGRCSHPHSKFKYSEAFQLRTAGLQYEHLHGELWQLKVGDAALWAKYQPFIGDKVESYAQLGAPQPQAAAYQPAFHQHQYHYGRPNNQHQYGYGQPNNQHQYGYGQLNNPYQYSNGQSGSRGLGAQVWDAAKDQVKDYVVDQVTEQVDWVGAAGEVLSWFL